MFQLFLQKLRTFHKNPVLGVHIMEYQILQYLNPKIKSFFEYLDSK